jgi:DNA helicase-2/ATP-dependent DNA helicase PcrA
MLADPFTTLNDAQRAAVEHGHGPLLVIAGAGSGKTLTLAARVARLVLDGADPNRILLLTFSRRAAQEMQRRVGTLLHRALGLGATVPAPQLPWSGTFHGVGARLLREYAGRIGLAQTFTILDRGDAEDLMALVRQAEGLADREQRFPLKGTCLAIYSRAVNSRQALAQVLQQHFPWCSTHEADLARLLRAYVAEKQRQQVLDYDDLLLYWDQMTAEPALAVELGARFDHVLVDEYQDTNRLQAAIVHALKRDGRGVTVVGDDAQAIYGFRAAEVGNILGFPQAFEPPARVLALERNYRSTQPILDASNAVIAQAAQRHAKALWTDRASAERPQLVTVDDELAQARWVADAVLRRRESGVALKRQAVLMRTGHHGAALELELARRGIPYVKFGGLKFLESAHVKDLLGVLRWVQNPRGRLAGYRVALLLPGFGPASARRLLDTTAQAADPEAAIREFRPPPAAAADWAALLALRARLGRSAWPDDVATALQWYRPHLERLHDDAAVRLTDLEQLARLAAGHASRERFLAELTLDPPEATSDEAGAPHLDDDFLILSTIHAAKGQEWTAVYVLNVVDGCMPSDLATGRAEEIEEERRLLYVAMTRARQHLALLVPQRFHVTQQPRHGDRHLYGGLSRFVPPPVAACLDIVERPAAAASEPLATAGAVVDLGARVRALFAR